MEIKSLEIEGLFGRYDYHIPFRGAADAGERAAVTILHGVNGVGKTTVLRFLDAFLRKERGGAWDAFRVVPFKSCTLRVSEVPPITVRPDVENEQDVLRCDYDGETVTVGRNVAHRTAPTPEEAKRATALLERYARDTGNVSFQFLQTARIDYSDPRRRRDINRESVAACERADRTRWARNLWPYPNECSVSSQMRSWTIGASSSAAGQTSSIVSSIGSPARP